MKKQRYSVVPISTIFIAALVLSGCATGRDLAQSSSAALETVVAGDKYITIIEANAYQDGKELTVSGKVKQIEYCLPRGYNGHVDVAVLAPDGTAMKSGTAKFSRTSNIRSRQATFATKFSLVADHNAKIIMAYHPLEAGNPNVSECRQNAALKAANLRAGS
jgi:hypothetical protein